MSVEQTAGSERVITMANGAQLGLPGRYAVERVFQDDPHAVAFSAHDRAKDRSVFIKARSTAHERADRLHREADMLDSLCHPQIPKLYDAQPDAEVPYMVTEYKQGYDDPAALFQQYPRPELAARLMLSGLTPLGYVHDQGVVHRDIKTANFRFSPMGTSLIDFDIAKCVQQSVADEIYKTAPITDRTITDGWIGTPAYAAPEQKSGGLVTERSDIYSAGSVLEQLLTIGHRLTDADRNKTTAGRAETATLTGKLESKSDEEVEREIATFRRILAQAEQTSDLYIRLLRVARVAMSDNPQYRYHSASQMAEAIQAAIR